MLVRYDNGSEDETDIRSILKSDVIFAYEDEYDNGSEDETDIRSILKSAVISGCACEI